ncbi:hypothetical protein GCM10009665_73200 [Kitasatospora nipponensis]|uniref:Diadenosine tetraphosphate (Ap4A) HIT family hydrolase n=1 Tax=Kitasatospora nipponensis TaxID=258049 RepID=A0ABN1X0C6_9ACTN
MTDLESVTATTEPGAYVRSLPIGERIALPTGEETVTSWPNFPIEGELRLKVLDEPVLPEPPRSGEEGPETCHVCLRDPADPEVLWQDEHWLVTAPVEPGGLPVEAMLYPRGHHDLADLPPERSAELGPLLQRLERAVTALGGIGRVHFNRWGDGAKHLHVWVIPRPEGMLQLRGSFLPLWGDLLPKQSAEDWAETRGRLAALLAADG